MVVAVGVARIGMGGISVSVTRGTGGREILSQFSGCGPLAACKNVRFVKYWMELNRRSFNL